MVRTSRSVGAQAATLSLPIRLKGTDIAPSFASIAGKQDFNVEKIASFLLEPHPKMPNMALSPEEVKDISAFIAEQPR